MKDEKEKKNQPVHKKSSRSQTSESKKSNYTKSSKKRVESSPKGTKKNNSSISSSNKNSQKSRGNSKINKASSYSSNKKQPQKNTPSKENTNKKKVSLQKSNSISKEKLKLEITNNELEKTLIINGDESQNLKEVVDKLEEENIVTKDHVIKRSKGKKTAIIILSVIMALVVIATIIYVYLQTATNKINSQTTNSDVYNKVSKNKEQGKSETTITSSDYEHIIRISLSEFEEKVLAKENMLVLIASETCYACVTFEPTVEELFAELDKTIYEVDISQYTEDDIITFRTYYNFTKTPTIFYIEDGIVTKDVVSSMSKEALNTWLNENIW